MTADQENQPEENDEQIEKEAMNAAMIDGEEEVADIEQDKSDEVVEERTEVFPGYTQEELTQALAIIPQLKKSIETQNGTYGRKFQQQEATIADLKEQLKNKAVDNQEAPAMTQEIDFKSLRDNGFEELADLLKKDIQDKLPSKTQIDMSSVEESFNRKIEEIMSQVTDVNKSRDIQKLDKLHPDWKDVATYTKDDSGLISWDNPDFGAWVSLQPYDTQRSIVNEDDPLEIAEWITKFKQSKDGNQQVKQRRSVLSKAVNPESAISSGKLSPEQEEREAMLKAMAEDD